MHAIASYSSHSSTWEERATIRSRPRRVIEDDLLKYYPADRQPLCAHPRIVERGEATVDFVLQQSLYKYITDIIIFETEIVNKTAREIAKGTFPFSFPFECRYDALSVVIDEDYHAYVAMDYMHQVRTRTGVEPIGMPSRIELSTAIPAAAGTLEERHQAGMELLGVAISENTVTADVAAFARDKTLKRSVKGLMADHLADEGRHSIFWGNIVNIYWRAIDEEARLAIGGALPLFLRAYLTNELQAEFDNSLIHALDLEPEVAAEIARDLVRSYPITNKHPMVENIRGFLERSGLLEHGPTRAGLVEFLPC